MTRFDHAVMIGTTGMLRGATQEIAARSSAVTLIARQASTFRFADEAANAKLHPIDADYGDEAALLKKVAAAASHHGPVSLLVTWIHPRLSTLRDGLNIHLGAAPYLYVEILGSAAGRPGAFGDDRLAAQEKHASAYRQVLLGFVVEDKTSRWLTHDEICDAAARALYAPGPRLIAGQIEPWEKRPA